MLEPFKRSIIQSIKSINDDNPSFKPIDALWNEDHYLGKVPKIKDFKLWLGSGIICNFHLYKSIDPDIDIQNAEAFRGLKTFNTSLVKHLS